MACFCFEDYSRILKVFEPYGEIHLLHKICSWTYVLGILVELKENRLYRVLERDSCSNMTKVLNVHIIQFRKKYGPKVKKKLIGTVWMLILMLLNPDWWMEIPNTTFFSNLTPKPKKCLFRWQLKRNAFWTITFHGPYILPINRQPICWIGLATPFTFYFNYDCAVIKMRDSPFPQWIKLKMICHICQ